MVNPHPITVIHRKRPRLEYVPPTITFTIKVISIEDSWYGPVAALTINDKPAIHVMVEDSIKVTYPT